MNTLEKTKPEIFKRIDNDLYNAEGDIWWRGDTVLHLLKTSVNPWRAGYQSNVIKKLGIDPRGKIALEVGSGGGILTEEIAKMGFTTTGIDPSEQSISSSIFAIRRRSCSKIIERSIRTGRTSTKMNSMGSSKMIGKSGRTSRSILAFGMNGTVWLTTGTD